MNEMGSEVWEKLPLVVVACAKNNCTIFDGHHRHAAAAVAGMQTMPVLSVSWKAYEILSEVFDIPRMEFIRILKETNPLMARNYKMPWRTPL
jgi:hypothetical protein